MWEYNNFEELYHYGVPGMRWGHRRNSAVKNAYQGYKQAKKDLRRAKIKRVFSKSTYLAGYENQQKNKQIKSNIKRLGKNKEKAAFKAIDAQAKYAYDRKLAKTGNKVKAEKASVKVYSKAMDKGKSKGLAGSAADKNGGNTRFSKHIVATKGKDYMKKVEKKYSRKLMKDIAGAAAVVVGSAVVAHYAGNAAFNAALKR